MTLLNILWKSLWNRRLTSTLTILSIGLSVMLLLGIERIRAGARESFSSTISQTDLIVGAKGGTIQLLLYSVFRLGSATANISYDAYRALKDHPAVKWVIPYSLGDSHRGFRVVGTTDEFYTHYRFRQDRSVSFSEGQAPAGIFDVALGSEVAEKLGYRLGDSVAVAHGVTDGPAILNHDDKPFKVVGILNKTATPIDRSLYITLEGLEAIHMDWQQGVPPRRGEGTPADRIRKENVKISQITAVLLRTKNRLETLTLQREINTFQGEPLMAIIPGVALSELWSVVSYAEDGLRLVSWSVLVVGLLAMLIALYTSLQERRREMAILRSVGAGLAMVALLLVSEALILTVLGTALGIALTYGVLYAVQPTVESNFGLLIPLQSLSLMEWIFVGVILVSGFLVGVVPAMKAYRNSLADGLAVRFILPVFVLLSSFTAQAKELEIASSVGWLREVASEITCGGAKVELLPAVVPAGTDPHTYQLTPRSKMAWANADIRLMIGAGFESWKEKSAGPSGKVFYAGKGVNLRTVDPQSAAAADPKSEEQGHSHTKGASAQDPHIWHSPRITREVALNMYNFLAPRAPSLRSEWDTCLRNFVQKTKKSEAAVHSIISTIPSSRRILATNHDSMGYFAEMFGLKVIAVTGLSSEAQITPGQMKQAIEAIRKSGAPAVFLESALPPDTMKKVAAEARVKLGGELFTDGLAAAGTPAGTITGLWETNAETIAKALRP
ncbi:MAG: hypothetical protein RIR26_1601 [Pseudomonadota bacterium]